MTGPPNYLNKFDDLRTRFAELIRHSASYHEFAAECVCLSDDLRHCPLLKCKIMVVLARTRVFGVKSASIQ
jgi:hypothetical protein